MSETDEGGSQDTGAHQRNREQTESYRAARPPSAATLGFGYDVSGALTALVLDFFPAGTDAGTAGFTDNFAWGTLDLAAGNTVRLFDGNTANAGTAFYVDTLLGADLFGDTVANIIGGASGLNIYYRADAAGNAYLGGLNDSLSGGGQLIGVAAQGAPLPSSTPEPSTAFLLAAGITGLLLRKRRALC